MTSLKIANAHFTFTDTCQEFLGVESLEIFPGINYLIGRNGAGKTSFLHGLSGIYSQVSFVGKITFSGNQCNPTMFGLISQNLDQSIVPALNFMENMILSKMRGASRYSLNQLLNRKNIEKVKTYIYNVTQNDHLLKLLGQPAASLSGGEKQMLAILMRCFRGCKILLLDEVTANLDEENTISVLQLVQQMSDNGKIILFSTHQHYLIKENPGCIYRIKNSKIKKVENGQN